MKSNPLWSHLVKVNNQISYSFFNQITFSYGPQVFVGLDGSLLQPMYINSFNRQYTPKDSILITKVNKLTRLKNLLDKKGVKLLVVANTNNLVLYPENVPSNFLDPTRFERKNSYEIIKEYLTMQNIPFVDNHQFLVEWKSKVDYKFFEPTGSHLNDVGVCLATNNLLRAIQKELPNKNIKNFECFPVKKEFPPRKEDVDLLDVSNLLFPNALLRAGTYSPKPKKLYKEAPLRILFVGTSFNFATQAALKKRNIANSKLYFYYRTLRTDDGVFHPFDKRKIDWENDIFKNDIIILESNYSGLGGIGYNFLTDAIKILKKELFTTEAKLKAWQNEISPLLIRHERRNKNKDDKEQSKENSEFNPFLTF
ncbi:MAG: alginate O-acetyltransferase AlgX-related protein [Bdellovibrionota bacterium]